VTKAVIPAGEQNKTLDAVAGLLDTFLDARFDRHSTLVALGGGVVGDLAGFAAAILLRGVRFVQVPTTIVAQVDASVGGKTGVDHPRGKNLIGAFHQPSLVAIDVATLRTLPEREVRAGLAEVVKHAVIRDADLFAHLEAELPNYAERSASAPAWVALISANCRIKAEVVAKDERESGLREILNYGHTTGHAVEAIGRYERYRHGEAVLFGMRVAGSLARSRGMWAADAERRQQRLIDVLSVAGPPTDMPLDLVWQYMGSDKKARAGTIRFVLPRRIGEATVVSDVSRAEFDRAWAEALSDASAGRS
jgi:3-dehydroquinate synthase